MFERLVSMVVKRQWLLHVHSVQWQGPVAMQCRHSSRASKRMLKLGVGPDGKPLPQANKKKVHPRMYPVLVVNQDGSTYTVQHRSPLQILPLPLDPSTLSEEQQRERERLRQAAKERVYVEEEADLVEDSWDQSQYRDLIDR